MNIDRQIIRKMDLHGRFMRLKLISLRNHHDGHISDELFTHQFERIIGMIPKGSNLPNPISGEEMLRRIKEDGKK